MDDFTADPRAFVAAHTANFDLVAPRVAASFQNSDDISAVQPPNDNNRNMSRR
jgi:hypothetical protein